MSLHTGTYQDTPPTNQLINNDPNLKCNTQKAEKDKRASYLGQDVQMQREKGTGL